MRPDVELTELAVMWIRTVFIFRLVLYESFTLSVTISGLESISIFSFDSFIVVWVIGMGVLFL